MESNEPVHDVAYLSNDDYDRQLAANVVLNEFHSASANNVIVDCLARHTPIVTNPHPAVVEYLGREYPLYFEHPDEVPHLLSEAKVISAHEYLAARNAPWLSLEQFSEDVLAAVRSTLQGARLTYAVVCSHRSGSTWLCDLLKNAGAGDPDEWWHPEFHAAQRDMSLRELEKSKAVDGIFGIKVLFGHGDDMAVRLAALRPDKIIRLRRHDRIAQAVSYYTAKHTDQWKLCHGLPRRDPPPYDHSRIDACLADLDRQEQAIDAWLSHRHYLEVWYERLLADPQAELRRILRYLGLPDDAINPQATLRIQRNRVTTEYCRRFRVAAMIADLRLH